MPHLSNPTLEIYLYCTVGIVLIVLGYQLGRSIAALGHRRIVASKEQELFTAQRGFKNLYEQELATVREQNAQLQEQLKQLTTKVEEYRKKAAGLGGLFNSGGKRADAMYALLLENEALEEALYSQNEKLRQERTDSLKDQLRATSYRRVLMSQLLNDERIKDYVAEIMQDERRLPSPSAAASTAPAPTALPAPQSS